MITAVHRRCVEFTKVLISAGGILLGWDDASIFCPDNADMLDGVEIRTVSGPVINEINVICPKKMYSVSSCMRSGIIMLKNRDVGVVMESRNDLMSENVIAVPLSI